MLFLALLVYIAAWFPLKALARSLSFLMNIKLPILHALMFILSLAIIFLIFFFAHAYQPEMGPALKKAVKIKGVRWMTLLTTLAAGVFFALTLFDRSELKYLFLPIAVISVLNWLGIDIWPRWFLADDPAIKMIAPRMPMPEIKQDIQKDFLWSVDGKECHVSITIRLALFEKFRSETPSGSPDAWVKELVQGGTTGEIRELGLRLAKFDRPYGTPEEVNFVLDFIRDTIELVNEEKSQPRFPLVTLVDQKGDTRDIAILCAVVLRSMGYQVAIVLSQGHAGLGICGVEGMPAILVSDWQGSYCYCERTVAGWKIGEIPEGQKAEDLRVYPV